MSDTQFNVIGMGNAIVDLIYFKDYDTLKRHELVKGSMSLINGERAKKLYAILGKPQMIPGGSAANTMVGLASLGGSANYIGKVGDDDLGEYFANALFKTQVSYDTLVLDNPAEITGRSIIIVTPDGERTMSTYLGAAQYITLDDVNSKKIALTKILFAEAYLWSTPQSKEAFLNAAKIAHNHNRKVALTLSDAGCVSAFRNDFLKLIQHSTVDMIFANEAEVCALYQTTHTDSAVANLVRDCRHAVVTLGERGAFLLNEGQITHTPAYPVEQIVAQTGAGDLFAAGYLYGETIGLSHTTSARLGAMAASEIIAQPEARPQRPLHELVSSL